MCGDKELSSGKSSTSVSVDKIRISGNSLVVQWLGLLSLTEEGLSSISGLGTKLPQAEWPKKKKSSFFLGLDFRILNDL